MKLFSVCGVMYTAVDLRVVQHTDNTSPDLRAYSRPFGRFSTHNQCRFCRKCPIFMPPHFTDLTFNPTAFFYYIAIFFACLAALVVTFLIIAKQSSDWLSDLNRTDGWLDYLKCLKMRKTSHIRRRNIMRRDFIYL